MMNDKKRTKAQLIDELTALRQRMAKLEEAAGKSQSQQVMLATVFENAPYILVLVNKDGRVENINRQGIAFAGRPKEKLLGLLGGEVFKCLNSFDGLGCGRDVVCHTCPVRTRITRTLQTGEPVFEEEGQLIVLDENSQQVTLDFLISTNPITVDQADMVLVTIIDITKRRQMEQALQESEERQRQIIENSGAGYFFIDRQGRFQQVNSAWLQMHKYENAEEVIGQHYSLTQVETDLSHANDNVEQLISGEKIVSGEFSRRCKDGSIGYHTFSARSVEKAGEIVGFEGFLIDITERKQIEEALRQSTVQQMEIVKAGNVGFWDWDFATDKVHFSAEWKRQIGYEEHEIGDDFEEWRSRVHPDDLTLTLEQVQLCIAKAHQDYQVEFRFRHKDGSYRWILAQGSVLQDETGHPIRMRGSHVDVTERKQAEEALQESQANLTALIENTDDRIWSVDTGYRLIVGNKAFCSGLASQLGHDVTPGESVLLDNFPQQVIDEWRTYYDRALHGETFEIETQTRFANQPKYVTYRFNPIRTTGGQVTGVVVIEHNITDRKQTEQEVQRLADVVNNMPVGLHMYHLEDIDDDRTLRLVATNPAATKFTGVAMEDVLGQTIDENFPDSRRLGVPQLYADVVRSDQVLNLGEVEYGDARVKHGIYSVTAFPLPQNHVGITFENITERKQIEQDLQTSEERYRLLFEEMLSGFALHEIICNENGVPVDYRFLSINAAFEKLTGLRAQDLLGKTVLEVMPETESYWIERYGHVALTGEPNQFEDYSGALDKYYEVRAYSPQRGQFAVVFSDITERKRAEESLRESEAFTRAVMDHLPIGVAVNSVDPTVDFAYMNGNFPKFYRTTRKALADPDAFWSAVYEDPEFRETIKKRILDDCATNDPERMHWEDIPIDRQGKDTTFISARNTPVPGKQLMISTVWDVTDRKQAEEKLKASLREKEVMLQEIHHRVKNNLQVISSLLDMQADTIADDTVLQALQDSQQRIRSMALVHEKLYRAEDMARIDFADYIEDTVDYLLMVYSDRAGYITPRLELAESFLAIDTAIPCGLIINELVSNAMKHAFAKESGKTREERETPEICIAFEIEDGECRLIVSDNGVGLPPHIDIDNSPSLGLQLVKILTGQLRGTIDIDRKAGTSFNITFPEEKLAQGDRR